MTFIKLKNLLLATELLYDNEYLDKYCTLCLHNLETKRQAYKTNIHHVIPVAFYRIKYNINERRAAEVIANNDQNNFKINLLFKDHLLAHYYLAMSAKGNRAVASMTGAIEFLTGHTKISLRELNLSENELLIYQTKYEESLREKIKEVAHKNTGKKRSEETKVKQSKAALGKAKSLEARKHMSEAKKGTKLTEEIKAKISASNKGRKQPWAGRKQSKEEIEKRRQKMLGHKTSDETRAKISQANKGKKRCIEVKKRLSDLHKGKSAWNKGVPSNIKGKISLYDPKTLTVFYIKPENLDSYLAQGYLKGNPKSGRKDGSGTRDKKVLCIEKNKIFKNIKEASEWCKGSVIQCLKGKSKTAGGYHWIYFDA